MKNLFNLFHNFLSNIIFLKQVCLLFGIIVFLMILKRIGAYIIHLFTRKVDLKTYGSWCVITGCTDGIGKSMAIEIAKRGLNMFLVGRNLHKLNEVANELKEITQKFGTEIRIFVMDLSDKKINSFQKFSDEIQNLDVGLLVNCAGISYPHAMYFDEISSELLDDLVTVNLSSALQITKIIYAAMRKRKNGAIIFVGSGASELPCEPLYAAYVAMKSAIASFCKNLQTECMSSNILVQCHTPLLVTTKLSKCKRPTFTVLTPEYYAKCALREIEKGKVWKSSILSPSFVHACIIKLANMIFFGCWKTIRLSQTQLIRNKAMKKK